MIPDLDAREWTYLLPFVLLMIWIGLYPKPFIEMVQPSIEHYLQLFAY